MDKLASAKIILREKDIPYFSDEEIRFYVDNYEFNEAMYKLLMLKSQNSSMSVSGVEIGDNSLYFRRLAAQYRPSHSAILKP